MRTINSELLAKIEKSQQTIYENANPSLKVLLSKGFSKDLFRVYTIHNDSVLGKIDATVKRSNTEDDPDKAYVVYIVDGVAHVKSKDIPYDEIIPWAYEFELGAAGDVAIELDGEWERDAATKKFNLVAEEYPWIFKIASGVLTAQYWQNSAIELASNVNKIRSLKGWVPANGDETNDQGIVVFYLKDDGNVYYRNYCIQVGGSKAWEVEKQLTAFTGTVVDIALFRTNDFRLGFVAQNADDTVEHMVTTRNWAGMSFEPETFTNPPGVSDFSMTQFVKEFITNDTLAETFNSPPSVSALSLNVCTVAELATVFEITFISYARELGEIYITFSQSVEIKDAMDFLANGTSLTATLNSITMVDNLMTISLATELPVTGTEVTIYASGLEANVSPYCVIDIGELTAYIQSDLPEQNETFSNLPGVSTFDLTQFIKLVTVHDSQPTETFSSTLSVSSFSMSIMDVNGDPL